MILALILFAVTYVLMLRLQQYRPWVALCSAVLFIVLGGVCVVIGSQFVVNGAMTIARACGMSERFIGLTIVAFGTSLPELVTSVSAARKGNAGIAIGNIVGSNIFNILLSLIHISEPTRP